MDGIFLHTGWRSSGTWLWERLRAQPGHMGFYEPLHEFLPGMGRGDIETLSPESWKSRHSPLSRPYFAEYKPLLRPGRRGGVALAERRFAFDRFFMPPETEDAALRAYIGRLIATAREQGAVPVLKCTRSQGRFGWFQKNFPELRHVLLIRQPWTQFCSAWRSYAETGNKYFLAAPFLVLERNIAHPEVAALRRALGLPLGWGRHAPLGLRLKSWKFSVRLMDPLTLYKAHLALWLLNALHALPHAQWVLDGDATPGELAAPFGLDAGRTTRPGSAAPSAPKLRPRDVERLHATALGALGGRLDDARVRNWLAAAERAAAGEGRVLAAASWQPA